MAYESAYPAAEQDGAAAGGESTTWKRSKIVPHTSRLKVGDERTLDILGMETQVRIDGFRARVLIDYYFHNPDDRQYEGTFKVRLPNEASPYFLAFGQSKTELEAVTPKKFKQAKLDDANPADEAKPADHEKPTHKTAFEPNAIMAARQASWIEPKEARIVPKEQAAYAYGETVRRRVDPALMEWAGPGMFSARIFPIAPNKVHRVVIGYDANLTAIGDDYEFTVPLPEGVPSTEVHVAVASIDGVTTKVQPEVAADEASEASYYSFSNPDGRQIRIRLEGAGATALTGSDQVGDYFAAQVTPQLPDASDDGAKNEGAAGAKPDAVFLVDTSLTANPDRFNVWRKLMRAILENNRGKVERFGVVFFNVESFWWRPELVANTSENVDALMEFTDTLALEGATDLGQAFDRLASGQVDMSRADVFLMSDASATWGTSDPYALSGRLAKVGSSLFAYRTGMTGDDTSMMEHLARETGGAVFSVVGESEVAAASTAHTAKPWTIRNVSVDGAKDVLLAGRPKTIFPGQRLTVVGRGGLAGGAKVDLELARGEEVETVGVPVEHVLSSSLTARAYGQVAVGQLEEFLGSTRPFAEAYARQYRVPGKSSSLLMLESEEDYKAYGIEPKADAATVRGSTVRNQVVNALDALASKLGDPKAAFTDWLSRASQMQGVGLAPSKSFLSLLEELPAESFDVVAKPLTCRNRSWEPVSKELREELGEQEPSYDTVVADAKRRLEKYGSDDALKALSSLVEANPADGVLARDIGYSATEWGHHGQAYHLFRRVADARPWEPQTYHAMALALAKAERANLALVYFEVALSGKWHGRFGSFDEIVRLDYLRFLRKTSDEELHEAARTFAKTRRAKLADELGIDAADMVVVIAWNTDRTDIDLHVTEPSGEVCYYGHPKTDSGGRLTRDVTQGYGPEMFVLEDAPRGDYRVRAKYYATDRNRAGTRTKVQATIYRNWGKPTEKVIRKTVTLEDGKEMHDIMNVDVKK
ncbi:hypothetical protein [Persicimonas caeni]|nr:hypothetical protein [Persicimonas caeni]